MGFFRVMGKIVKPHVDVPRWLDYRAIANTTTALFLFIKNLFIPKKAIIVEDFNQAKSRLKLNDEELIARQKEFYYLAYVYLILALIVFAYAGYLLFFNQAFLSSYISFIIGAIILAHAFRKRFWYYQVKTRRLGYSFRQWFCADILRKSNNEKTNS